ncbi:putative nucleic-acid-binding protein containing a Zn-ribbon [Variovorax sp. PBL-H6]|uniref:Zn-ribbon domain-containing OB-fold protein n=1 Tax=Variovorax sp. PBL-H6 TaxID=434009 RepID=UPI0013176066|nr:OB-fold domain-containing protein [Variovorax sp. PBL-H6]VTU33542.1 putative nucleic-acid-binding protein containing a Zn-ribbon [Variovorax sp. PBL-H6]
MSINAADQLGPEAFYRQRLAEGVFQIQRCQACGKHFFYPRVLCRHCGSDAVEWVSPSGCATVYSTTVVRRKPEDGGSHNVAVVELNEGPRMMTRVEGIAPESVRIGSRVSARVAREGAGTVLVFDARAEGA